TTARQALSRESHRAVSLVAGACYFSRLAAAFPGPDIPDAIVPCEGRKQQIHCPSILARQRFRDGQRCSFRHILQGQESNGQGTSNLESSRSEEHTSELQ